MARKTNKEVDYRLGAIFYTATVSYYDENKHRREFEEIEFEASQYNTNTDITGNALSMMRSKLEKERIRFSDLEFVSYKYETFSERQRMSRKLYDSLYGYNDEKQDQVVITYQKPRRDRRK